MVSGLSFSVGILRSTLSVDLIKLQTSTTSGISSHNPSTPLHSYSFNDNQGINTLFVSGLPDDVKAREIHELFFRCPGFDFCQLKSTGKGNQVLLCILNWQDLIQDLNACEVLKPILLLMRELEMGSLTEPKFFCSISTSQ